MKKVALTLSMFLISMNALAGDYDTPEMAIRTLEKIYAEKNIEKVLEARDFEAEAKFMIQKMNPKLSNDMEVMKKIADLLLLGTRQEIESGFPDFTNLKCTLHDKKTLDSEVVQFNEVCIFPHQGKSEQLVHAYKGKKGWRFINYVTEKP